MRPITRFRHLMSSRVQIAPRTGLNSYGEPSYGTDVGYDAHLSGKRTLVRNPQGQEVVSRQAIYLAAAAPVQLTDRVTLSTGDVGSTESASLQPVILAVARLNDQYGPHHTVVYLE